MLLRIMICALAAFGLLLIFGAFLRSVRTVSASCHVICLQGGSAQTEQQIKACLRRQRDRLMPGKLIFVDQGLDPEGQMTAQLLLINEPEALLCAPGQAVEYVIWEIENFGAGTD